jgi:histidinol dehydrogenase
MRSKRPWQQILADVKKRGDAAVLEYTNRFDRVSAGAWPPSTCRRKRVEAALEALPEAQRAALQTAAERIRAFHERQKQELNGFTYTEADGTVLGQRVTPLDRVGIYVPGGKAAYPSSVLMNAIPAQVAGVQDIVMVVPTPDGVKNQMVLAAAAIAGVTRVITIGGAQAVAALAYGTETIPAVDKIVGPGNAYVAAAKRRVFGVVGIDMIAGPSEILVLCDGTPIRTGSRWTCSRRPSTTNWRRRSCCARTPTTSPGSKRASTSCCRPCRARRPSSPR